MLDCFDRMHKSDYISQNIFTYKIKIWRVNKWTDYFLEKEN